MARLDIASAVKCLSEIASPDGQFAALHEPRFAGEEWNFVKDCLDTGWVSSVGAYVDRFEQDLARAFGVERAVAVVNGTAALHIALKLAGVKEGDEVLVPALTFVATANAAAYCGAIPHFCDSEWSSLGLDPVALDRWLDEIAEPSQNGPINRRTAKRLAALVPMHVFGHPARMDELLAIARKWNIPVIEDAAESLGSLQNGKPVGGRGLAGITSFNGNKIITTGGGGAILTNDPDFAHKAKHLTTTAKIPHRWAFNHDELGYNYRLPNLNAALGCAQLLQLPEFLAHKRHLAQRYKGALAHLPGLRFFEEPQGAHSNYWLNAVVLDDASQCEAFLAATNDANIMTRPCWTLMCDLPIYGNCPSMPLPIARDIVSRVVNIPSSVRLGMIAD